LHGDAKAGKRHGNAQTLERKGFMTMHHENDTRDNMPRGGSTLRRGPTLGADPGLAGSAGGPLGLAAYPAGRVGLPGASDTRRGGPGGHPRGDRVLAAVAGYFRGRKRKSAHKTAPPLGATLPFTGDLGQGSTPSETTRPETGGGAVEPTPGERKMGEMLKATPRASGTDKAGRSKKLDGSRLLPSNPPPTLASLGISKRESAAACRPGPGSRATATAILADPPSPPDRRRPCRSGCALRTGPILGLHVKETAYE